MKRLLATAAIFALTAGAANAAGLEEGWYLGLGAGWNHAEEADFERAGVRNSVEYDEGWVGNASLGYAWRSNWRAELEGSYRSNAVDSISGTGASGGSGDFKSWAAMANVYYDFKNDTPWTPYIGGGIGASFQNADEIGNVFAATTNVDDQDTQFAYQGIVGLDYWLNDTSAWGLRYNYFASTDGHFETDAGTTRSTDGEYSNHSVLVTFRYGFNKPKPAPVEPKVAPAPVQRTSSVTYTNPNPPIVNPTPQQVDASPHKIYFALNSAEINGEGMNVVRDVAMRAQNRRVDIVHLTANTDTTGSKTLNDKLSQRRADAVRNALISRGVDASRINVFSNAEKNLPVPTADGVLEPRNRVVTIVIND